MVDALRCARAVWTVWCFAEFDTVEMFVERDVPCAELG